MDDLDAHRSGEVLVLADRLDRTIEGAFLELADEQHCEPGHDE